MNEKPGAQKMELLLARLLYYGTWLASSCIALGLVVACLMPGSAQAAQAASMRAVTMGIALLILLPVSRVALMLSFFVQSRDYRLAVAAALVLAFILVGGCIGIRSSSGLAG